MQHTQMPLRPRCALRVAVVGNRRFGGETDQQATPTANSFRTQASAGCGAVWTQLFEGIGRALDTPLTPGSPRPRLRDLFKDERPRLAVLSALAAGADQIATRSALEVGAALDGGVYALAVELEAVLPFPESQYPGLTGATKPEFRADEAEALRQLVFGARQTVRLEGDYDHHERRGYQYARDRLLECADVLLAVYDPFAEPRAGGSVETLKLALEANTPIIAVLVGADAARIAVYSRNRSRPPVAGDEWKSAARLEDLAWREALNDCVRNQLMLPEAARLAGAPEDSSAQAALAFALRRMQLFTEHGRLPTLCTPGVFRRLFEGAWESLLALRRSVKKTSKGKDGGEPATRAADAVTLEPFAEFYARASELAGAFMGTYRGAFVLSYFLAGLTVSAAVALMTVSLLNNGHPPVEAIVALGGLKLGLLVVLLVLERAAHRERLQDAAADFRYLAEILRPMQWLAFLGTYPPAVELALHAVPHDPRRSWMVWLARAVARTRPCVASSRDDGCAYPRDVQLDASVAASAVERAGREWLQGQALYHGRNAHLMGSLDEGLERAAKRLLYVVIAAAAVAILLELLPHAHIEPLSGYAERLHTLAVVLGALAAALPAFIAALAGVAFQSEAKRLAARSEAMHQAHRDHQGELDTHVATLRDPDRDDGGEAVARATQTLREISGGMIEEVGDWKVLYPIHKIHAG